VNSVSPVLTEAELPLEQVVALDQPEYYPIIVARIVFEDGQRATYTRFRFTEEERKLISEGADLLIVQPHVGPMMPISVQLAMKDEYPV